MSRALFLYYILKWWMHILRVYTDACNEHLDPDRALIYNKRVVNWPITWLRLACSIKQANNPIKFSINASVNALKWKKKKFAKPDEQYLEEGFSLLSEDTRRVGFTPLLQLLKCQVICQWQKSTVDWLFKQYPVNIHSTHLAPEWDKTNTKTI